MSRNDDGLAELIYLERLTDERGNGKGRQEKRACFPVKLI